MGEGLISRRGGGVKVNGDRMTVGTASAVNAGDLGMIKKDYVVKNTIDFIVSKHGSRTFMCVPLSDTLFVLFYTYNSGSYGVPHAKAFTINPSTGALTQEGTDTVIGSYGGSSSGGYTTPLIMSSNSFIIWQDNSTSFYISVSSNLTITASYVPSKYCWTVQKYTDTEIIQSYSKSIGSNVYDRVCSIYNLTTGVEGTHYVVERITDSSYMAGYRSQSLSPLNGNTCVFVAKLGDYLSTLKFCVVHVSNGVITYGALVSKSVSSYGSNYSNTYLHSITNAADEGCCVFYGNERFTSSGPMKYPLFIINYSGMNIGTLYKKDRIIDSVSQACPDNLIVSVPKEGGYGQLTYVVSGGSVLNLDLDVFFDDFSSSYNFVGYSRFVISPYTDTATWTTGRDNGLAVVLYVPTYRFMRISNAAGVSLTNGSGNINVLVSR